MLESTYKINLAVLTEYLGCQPNDTQYRFIWSATKHLTEPRFAQVCRHLVNTFVPTSTNPFPIVCHFVAAIDATRASVDETRPQIVDKAELPTPEEARLLMDDLRKAIRQPQEAAEGLAASGSCHDRDRDPVQVGGLL